MAARRLLRRLRLVQAMLVQPSGFETQFKCEYSAPVLETASRSCCTRYRGVQMRPSRRTHRNQQSSLSRPVLDFCAAKMGSRFRTECERCRWFPTGISAGQGIRFRPHHNRAHARRWRHCRRASARESRDHEKTCFTRSITGCLRFFPFTQSFDRPPR